MSVSRAAGVLGYSVVRTSRYRAIILVTFSFQKLSYTQVEFSGVTVSPLPIDCKNP